MLLQYYKAMNQSETIFGQVIGKANHYLSVPGSDGERRIIKDDAIRAYEASFAQQCRIYRDKNIDEPFVLDITIWYNSFRFDLDNSLKTVLDCLQYVHAIRDDNKCIEIRARKRIDTRTPRLTFTISPIMESLF